MKRSAKTLFVLPFVFGGALHAWAQAAPPALPAGQVIESVACAEDSSETYAAYLPASYTPAKRWPILYAFDPMARGSVPVKLYKDVAERYGYILVASNTSRNFSLQSSSKSANAMWQDTHLRFALDPRRIYTAGFSGGARVAGMVALSCAQCRIAGVIAFGAGYPNPRPARDSLLYFFGVGDQDFNWPEVMGVRREREQAGEPYRVRMFSGQHEWGPAEVMEDALQWMQLKAMQAGSIPPDRGFVDQRFRQLQDEAAEANRKKDAIAQLNAERSLVSDFSGLRDTGDEANRLARLKASAEFRAALRKEDEQISQQAALTEEVAGELQQLGQADLDQRLALRTDIRNRMADLKSRADHAKTESQRLVLLRALSSLWVNGIESGQAHLRQKAWPKAMEYFQLISDISPNEPWPCLLMAETSTAMGDKKQAIKYLREAVRRGLKNPDVLEKDDALKALREEPEYRELLQQISGK